MSIGEKFATKNEVEILRRNIQRALTGATIVQHAPDIVGISSFIELSDVPGTYAAAGNFAVRVKSTVDALEFAELKGTTNQVYITPHAADYVFSLPQDIHTAATPTFAGMYLTSASAAPFLKLTNASDTARDPIIQFAVGATPVTKFTMGMDDSDGDKWKLAVGDEFGDDHDTLVVTSGEGSTPGVAEFTLIDTFVADSPRGICSDGTYLYYSYHDQLVKVDIADGTELARSPGVGANSRLMYQCVTDGTYVYVACRATSTIRKYLCTDLTDVASSAAWTAALDGLYYWAGYVYYTNYTTDNIRCTRCSDMATIWTTTFTTGSGDNQLSSPFGIAVDGQYIYVQDCTDDNNRIVRLNMDGTWVDSVAVINSMHSNSIAMWCAGDYVYNTAYYTSVYKVEKRNKSDLSISETFSIVPDQSQAGCQWGDYHYVVHSGDDFIYKYQYMTSPASATAGIQFRLKDAFGQFIDIAKLTANVRFGVGTTIPSETIEAVGNVKAQAGQLISTKAPGTAPVVVSSTTVCTNLNAGLVDGFHHDQSLLTTAAPLFDHLHLSATSNQLVLQSAGVTGTITATPATSNKVWTLQNVTGTIYQTGGTDVAVADGGTNKSAWTLYAIPYASGTTTIGEIAIGTAGQVLAVNGGANGYTWAAAGGSLALNDLTDVVITAAATGDIIRFDGSNWVDYPDSNYSPVAGSASIVTVGSITTGGWHGTTIDADHGGTGATTLADGGIVIGNGTGAVEVVAAGATTQILVGGGASTKPAWGTDIPTAVTIGTKYIYRAEGTDVPVADGGTGASTFALNGILFGNAANAIGVTAIGTEGQFLRVGANPYVPAWSTLTLPNAGTIYRLPVFSAANVMTELAAVGATGEYLKGNTGAIPSWATLNQAAVDGLKTTDGPTFDHVHLTSGQIGFPATQVPSADANTLDDYAEGTKEVAFSCGTSGTITIDPSYKTIHYNKIGRQVTVVGYLAVASVSSPVGWWGITGLPFTSAVHSVASIWSSGLQATAITTLMGFVRSGTTTIEIYKFSAGAAGGVAADVKAGAEIVFTAVYFI